MTDKSTVQSVSLSVTVGDKTLDLSREVIWGWNSAEVPDVRKLLNDVTEEAHELIGRLEGESHQIEWHSDRDTRVI